MIELHLTTEISYQELVLNVVINIARWVSEYRTIGADAFQKKVKYKKKLYKD